MRLGRKYPSESIYLALELYSREWYERYKSNRGFDYLIKLSLNNGERGYDGLKRCFDYANVVSLMKRDLRLNNREGCFEFKSKKCSEYTNVI